jgi:DNA-binding HxlR family transcriptional regulator
VRVVYELTDAGRALNEVIQSISDWALAWMPSASERD